MLPRDLHLPWDVACRVWKSHGLLSARSVLPSLSGDGGVWALPVKVLEAKVCLTVMGNAWEGEAQQCSQTGGLQGKAGVQAVCFQLALGWSHLECDLFHPTSLVCHLLLLLELALWAQESSAFIPVLNSYRSHLETFFYPFWAVSFG